MAITAQLYDGTIISFPDGTDSAVINSTAKRLTAEHQIKHPEAFGIAPKEGLSARTTEEIYTAIRNADAAGDGVAVKQLGAYLASRQSGLVQPSAPKETLQTNTTNSSNTSLVQVQPPYFNSSYYDALITAATGVFCVVIFVIIFKAWKAAKTSLQQGIKWAALGAGLGASTQARGIAEIVFHLGYKVPEDLTFKLVGLTVINSLIGFLLGWLYGKFFKFKTDSKLSNQADMKLFELEPIEIDAEDKHMTKQAVLNESDDSGVTQNASSEFFPNDMSPSSIAFWRHFVALFGAMVVLGSKPMWPYGILAVVATHVGELLWALGLAGLVYLFFTKKMKGKFWRLFIQISWFIAVAVITKNLGVT